MASPDELMRAVEDLRDTLNSMSRQGVSRIADLAQLKILITRYPADARAFLEQLGHPANRRDER